MEWRQYQDRDGETRFVSEDPEPKKLVDNDGMAYYIIREKISAIYERKLIRYSRTEEETGTERSPWTVFIVDGESITIKMHIDNAYEWLVSWQE